MILITNKELDITAPEGLVFTNNGCYDLEKDGITGYYAWIGYKFDERGRAVPRLERELEKYVYDTVKPAFKSLFGVTDHEVIVEDRRATSATFRVWVATYEK